MAASGRAAKSTNHSETNKEDVEGAVCARGRGCYTTLVKLEPQPGGPGADLGTYPGEDQLGPVNLLANICRCPSNNHPRTSEESWRKRSKKASALHKDSHPRKARTPSRSSQPEQDRKRTLDTDKRRAGQVAVRGAVGGRLYTPMGGWVGG